MRRWSLLLLMACASPESAPWQQISPLHGGTGVAPTSPLSILADDASLTLPSSWLESLVHLVDLSNGADVPGTLDVSAGELRFVPAGPLSGRYAWTVDAFTDDAHGPRNTALTGSAVFETTSSPRILAAGWREDYGELCFVLSQAVDDLSGWSMELEGNARLMSEASMWPADRPDLLDPVSLVCIPDPEQPAVRVAWDDQTFQWSPEDDSSLLDVLLTLRSLQ